MICVEIVLQTRDPKTNDILDHIHLHFHPDDPLNFIINRSAELERYAQDHDIPMSGSVKNKPCSLCYDRIHQKPHDHS